MKLRSQKTLRFKSSKSAIIPNDKWATLQNILERGSPQTCETSFNYQVHGVYSLPEFWGKLQASGSVEQWGYTVKLSDCVLEGGKFNQRELTEDEKKEIEDKKKKPVKINKKDLEAVRAEEERIEREAREKEEREKAFQEKLDKMEEQERYYYLKELPTKEPWVSWNEKNIASINKSGEKLIELESDVNSAEGMLLELNFVPNPDENEKKRPKPKGISLEEVKPVYCISWIDLSEFHKTPGLVEITLRSRLMLKETYEKRIDDLEAKTGVKEFNPYNPKILEMIKENEEENKDYVEKAETYIYIKIVLSQPINPVLPDIPLPDPLDFIKKEEKTVKAYSVDEIEKDLLRQFKIAIAAIAKIYDEAMGESAKGQLIRREKGNILSNAKREERDNNINKFLEKFNNSGRANLLKEKLKKFIVKIVREKYNKKNTSVKGVFKDKRDQFYSELYAYLTDYVKKATDEFVQLKKDEIHEHVLVSFAQSKKEIMNYAIRQNKEPEDKRLLRLSRENELLDDYAKAVKYYKAILGLEQTKTAWLNYLNLAKKLDDINEVEIAITNAITIEPEIDDLNLKIIFCGLLFLKGQTQNAINFMNLILLKKGLKETSCIFNAFLAFLYKEKSLTSSSNANKPNDLLFQKHFEAAKSFKMKSIPPEELKPKPKEEPEELPTKENEKKAKENEKDKEKQAQLELEIAESLKKGNPKLNPNYQPPELSIAQCDSIWFDTINLFNSFNFYEISEKLLNYVNEESKSAPDFRITQAKIFLFRKDYDKVIEECDQVLKNSPMSYLAHLLKGQAYYYMKNYTDAESSYIRAIRFKPQEIPFDLEMLTKLGLLYINTESWYNAKVIFQQILRDSVEHSFAWRYLGFVLTKLGEYDQAEKALTQANLLDVENPTIWAYLTLFCLHTKRRNQAIECLNELIKVNFRDIELLKEIASLFMQIGEYELTANIYIKIKSFIPDDADAYLKIADIYFNHIESKKKEAIEILKEGKERVFEDQGKEDIEEAINEYIGKEDMKITMGKIHTGEDDLNLSESQIKGGELFDEEGEEHKDFDKTEEKKEEEKNISEKKENIDNLSKEEEKKEEEKNEDKKEEAPPNEVKAEVNNIEQIQK